MSRGAASDRSDLARRLADVEATIAALLTGRIDAVTDAGSGIPLLLADAQAALRESESLLREQAVALRDNEERTNYAMSAARMGVWEVDLRTNALTWSASTAALYGLTLDQAPRNTDAYMQLVHIDDRATLANERARHCRRRRFRDGVPGALARR